ncbi:MAG TPA: hypothetical protein VIC25_11020 [Caulobacteraceae bacterium]|jgi:hypothetical protein
MISGPEKMLLNRLGKSRFVRLAPYFALGPVSGPLTAGIVINWRGGRPVLAGLYATALALWLVLAPLEAAKVLPAGLAHLI